MVNTIKHLLLAICFLPSLAWGDYAATVLSDKPSVYWRLNEASGTTATDSSGFGHTGTYSASGWTYSTAALKFSDASPSVTNAGTGGTGTYVSIDDNSVCNSDGVTAGGLSPNVANATNGFVTDIIVKPNSIRSQAVYGQCLPSNCLSGWIHSIFMDGTGHFHWYSNAEAVGSTVATSGTTYHVAGYSQGSNVAPYPRQARLYVNGIIDGNATAPFDGFVDEPNWSIAKQNGSTSNAGAITVSDFAMYCFKLTDARIKAHADCALLGTSCNGTNSDAGMPFSVKRQEIPISPVDNFFSRLADPTWLDYALGVRFQSPFGHLDLHSVWKVVTSQYSKIETR